jgi:hypothetical protein
MQPDFDLLDRLLAENPGAKAAYDERMRQKDAEIAKRDAEIVRLDIELQEIEEIEKQNRIYVQILAETNKIITKQEATIKELCKDLHQKLIRSSTHSCSHQSFIALQPRDHF